MSAKKPTDNSVGFNRRHITMPESWWAAFEAAADEAGQSLSHWIGVACKAALPKAQQAKLPKRPKPGRPRGDAK